MLKAKEHLLSIDRLKIKSKREKMLRLDMNEGVPGLPKKLIDRALKRIDADAVCAYPAHTGLEAKISRSSKLKRENVLLSNGSDGAIKYIFDAFISPGDKVVYTDPTFAMYPVYCSIFQAIGLAVPYLEDFNFPFDNFIEKIKKGCRMAVIVNPNNPTGNVISRRELEKIASICRKKGTLLIIDEAYCNFYSGAAARLIKRYNNVCILRTFSKFFGMAGLRLGFCLSDKYIINSLIKVKPTFDVNIAAVIFAETILDSSDIVPMLTRRLEEGKRYLICGLERYNVEYRVGGANFVLIKCGGRLKPPQAGKMLAKNGILIASGFKQDFLKDYIRVTIGAVPEMRRFLRAFTGIIKRRADA